MDQARFHELCHQASHLAVIVVGRISNLVLTQANDGNEPIIREPEMRHAFCPTLESDGWRLPYGIEVPTKRRYRFVDETGENKTTARHDLVLLTEVERALKRDVLFESKREQPSLVARPDGIDCPAISKDYRVVATNFSRKSWQFAPLIMVADAVLGVLATAVAPDSETSERKSSKTPGARLG